MSWKDKDVVDVERYMAEWRQKNLAKPNNPSLRTLLNALKVTTQLPTDIIIYIFILQGFSKLLQQPQMFFFYEKVYVTNENAT